MTDVDPSILSYLHPYDVLSADTRALILDLSDWVDVPQGHPIYALGDTLTGLYIIADGQVTVTDANDAPISLLGRENSFGERGLLQDGSAVTQAVAETDCRLLVIPSEVFHDLLRREPDFARFYQRTGRAAGTATVHSGTLAAARVDALMVKNPVSCSPATIIQDAARLMSDAKISSLCIVEGDALKGIVTLRDVVGKVVAHDISRTSSVASIMTETPRVLSPSAIGSDVLHLMMEHRLGHLPVVSEGRLIGIVTQTDLIRYQALHTAIFVGQVAGATSVPDLAAITARIPQLLVQLVASGQRHDTVTRMIPAIADVVTRRLIRMGEDALGVAPGRYVWLACGSQGRQEQTGVSDQDNCLIYEDGLGTDDTAYFDQIARFVSDGLNACGYVYCPGDMMATNPRWCQPVSVWASYFHGWIASPGKEAQMLASVMFDLRVIGGDDALFDELHAETQRHAAENSIFTAHMASNALTHGTPLGLLRGLSTIRAGEHRDTIDMKLNGVVPVVDLGRMYALQGQVKALNTRARIEAALECGIISKSGGHDLLDAYDLIAQTRLDHQARLIKQGNAPDNFLLPATLSGFERSHLRDAFVVIKTMQSALMQGRGTLA